MMRELRSGVRRGRSATKKAEEEKNPVEGGEMVIRRRRTAKKNKQEKELQYSPMDEKDDDNDNINDSGGGEYALLRGCSSVQVTTEIEMEKEEVEEVQEQENRDSEEIREINEYVIGDPQMEGFDDGGGNVTEGTVAAEEEEGNRTPLPDKEACELRKRSAIAQMALRINDEMSAKKRYLEKGLLRQTLRDESSSSYEMDDEIREGYVTADIRERESTKRGYEIDDQKHEGSVAADIPECVSTKDAEVRSTTSKQNRKEKVVHPPKATPTTEDGMRRTTRSSGKRKMSDMDPEQPNLQHYHIEAPEEFESESSMKRNVRGSTTLPHISNTRTRHRKVVEYNEHGQPIGQFSAELASYMGVLARQMVPIVYEKWKSVPTTLKEELWRSLEAKYVLEPSSSKLLVNGIGDKWRSFKSTLTRKYVLPFKNEPDHLVRPPPMYRFIKQEHWDAFVKSRLNDAFQALHKAQSERRGKNIYPHRLGRTGYAGLIEKIKKSEGLTPDQLDRCVLWKKARQNKNGEYDDDVTREQAEIIDELKKQVEDGSLVCDGNVDVLTLALGTPEHSGRVRGAGKFVSQSTFFRKPKRQTLKVAEKLDEQRKLIENKWQEERVSRLRVEDQLLNTQDMVSRLEETLAHFMQNGKKLAVTSKGVPLNNNENLGNSSTPVSNRANPNNHETSASASSQSIVCRYDKENLPEVQVPGSGPLIRIEKDSNISAFQRFYNSASQRLTGSIPYISVPVDAVVFGTDMELYLDLDDIGYMCHMEDLSANCIMVYMRHLYDLLTKRKMQDKYEFINPASVSSAKDEDVSKIITARLQNTNCEWILLPFNPEGAHWLLVVINMLTMSCYWLDPLGLPTRYNIKPFVTVGLKCLQKSGVRRPSPVWYNIKCPKQKSSVECGFYIMKYMREIIDEASNIFTRNEPFPKSTYEQNEIDEVRLEWIQAVEEYV